MAFDHEDLYTIMGVPRTASYDEIKRTYKQLALIHHPDRHGGEVDPAMADRFKEVATAYEVLGDDKARRKYDTELRAREQQRPTVGAFGREPRRANGLSPHVIHPTRPVRQAFVCECIDNMQRTFDIDATAFPSTLEHGDQVIVGGDTGVVLGVTEDAVWWWKNGCKLPSRLGSSSQFRIDGSGYALKWRRTGNVFVNQAKASRICELEKRRLDSLQRFKKKKKEQEQKETRDRKRQERGKAATKELAQIFSKEKVRRAQVEMELLVELSELFARIGFEQRVAAYWVETKSVFKGLVEAADDPPTSRPLSRSSSALAGSLRLGSTLGQLSAASLPRLGSRLNSARALLSVAVDADEDDEDDEDEGGEGMVQADFDELLNRSHRSACTFTTTTTSSSACCSDIDADDLLPLDTARTVRQSAPSASFPPPTLRFGVKKKEDEAAAEKKVKSPERRRKKTAKKPVAGTSPVSTTTTATTANSSNGGFFSWETTRRPEPKDRKKSSTRKAVTPTSTKTAKTRSLSFGATPQGGMARKASTSPLPGRDHPHSQSMHVAPSSPVSMHSSRRSVYTSNTAGFVDPARGDIRVEPNRIGPSRRDGSNSPPLHRLSSAAPASTKLGHKSSETPTRYTQHTHTHTHTHTAAPP